MYQPAAAPACLLCRACRARNRLAEPRPNLSDSAALDAFDASWRAGTLPKPEWTHAADVAVCAWTSRASGPGSSVAHLAAGATASRFHGVRSAVAAFGEARNLHAAHYRFDVTRDPAAPAIWVAPDAVTKQDN